jgi:hypothetical protein
MIPMPPKTCFHCFIEVSVCFVRRMTFEQVKKLEAKNRMAAIRRARRSPAAAMAEQKRASLVGDGAKWRITNLAEVVRALAKAKYK